MASLFPELNDTNYYFPDLGRTLVEQVRLEKPGEDAEPVSAVQDDPRRSGHSFHSP